MALIGFMAAGKTAVARRLAQRLVCADGYRLSFAADGREVPLKDPLTLLVANFVRAISRADPRASRHREIATRMELLERIVAAYPHPGEGT